MNTTDSTRQRLNPEFSIKGLESAFGALDANRATGYAQLGQMRSAKSASLAREQKFLAIKHGSTSTPRAQYAAAALGRNEGLRRELASAQEVLETPAPQVDDKSFIIYGFVRRRDQTGIPGLTLALTDADGTWIKEAGYACTDERGYFELRVAYRGQEKEPADNTKPLTEAEKRAAEAKAAATGAKEPTAATRVVIDREERGAQLRVFHRDGRVLHIESRPIVPKIGAVDYRLIILDGEDCDCTPPPEKSDGKIDPKAPRAPSAPPAAPAQPAPTTTAPRVNQLKSYTSTTPTTSSGQPLEAIRGIGSKRADKLRSAGIEDVAEFEKTPGAALVKVAGFDKTPPKAEAKKPAAEKTVTIKPAAKTSPTKASTTKTAATKTEKKPK